MVEVSVDELSRLVQQQVEDILAGRPRFTLEQADDLDTLKSQVGQILQNENMARMLSGPTFIDGTSVIDGTITAPKIVVDDLEAIKINTGNLNITGDLVAAASYPAGAGSKIVMNSAAFRGYNASAQKTFELLNDGSGTLGYGATQVSWNPAGVMVIPVATISGLTIAEVGGGIIGGTYQTDNSGPRVEMSALGGIKGYDGGGVNTFHLSPTNGSLTHTGIYTVQNATSGARTQLSENGIRGYNAGGVQTFNISAANGSGFMGRATSGISWSADGSGYLGTSGAGLTWAANGTVTVPGTLITSGIVAANITVGTLTAARISGGNLAGGIGLGTSDITVGGTGKIKFGANALDFLSDDLLHFELSASEVGKIEFKRAAVTPYAEITSFAGSAESHIKLKSFSSSGYTVSLLLNADAGGASSTIASLTMTDAGGSSAGGISMSASGNVQLSTLGGAGVLQTQSTNRRTLFYGYIYPGTGSAVQATAYLSSDGAGGVDVTLGDTGGSDVFYVRDSAPANIWGVNSNGQMIFPAANNPAALGSYHGRVGVYIGGSLKYLAAYNA